MTTEKATVLVVDDDVRALESLERVLIDHFEVRTARSAADASKILKNDWVQVVLCDQRMPGTTGVEFLKEVRRRWPDVVRIMISAYTDPDEILAAVNEAGIFQYVTKPWEPQQLVLTLRNAAELFSLCRQNELLGIELKLAPRRLEETVSKKAQVLRRAYVDNDGVAVNRDNRVF